MAPFQKGIFENAASSLNRAVRIAITVPHTTWEKYERVCNLANHSNSTSNLAKVFDVLVENYLKHHDPALKTARGAQSTSQKHESLSHSRYIPSHVKIEVWKRDSGQCTYCDKETGERCPCKRGLQFDHIEPFAWGGKSNDVSNIRLLCEAHNKLMAEELFGRSKVARSIAIQGARAAYTLHPKHENIPPERIDF
jgi:5-methylcytosine-specific restriction endonuclease McrA